MGRMGGASGALKKLKQKRAAQLGIPTRRVGMVGVAKSSGLRTNIRDNRAKPGLVIKIGQNQTKVPGIKRAPTLDKALKIMKHTDSKFLMKLKRTKRN